MLRKSLQSYLFSHPFHMNTKLIQTSMQHNTKRVNFVPSVYTALYSHSFSWKFSISELFLLCSSSYLEIDSQWSDRKICCWTHLLHLAIEAASKSATWNTEIENSYLPHLSHFSHSSYLLHIFFLAVALPFIFYMQ